MRLNQYIYRDPYDRDMFHVGHTYRHDQLPKRKYSRTAFNIHVDDIAGIFGDQLYDMVIDMEPGQKQIIFVSGYVSEVNNEL